MNSKIILPILILFFSAGIFSAQENLTLDECLTIAMQRNPLIKSSQQQYRASLARVRQARAFNQPTFDFDSDLQSELFGFKGSGEQYIGFSQLLEFPGKRLLRGKIAGLAATEYGEDMAQIKLDLIYAVTEAFYQFLHAIELQTYARENMTLADDFLNKAQLKFQSGDVARMDVLRAKVEAARARNDYKVAANRIVLSRSNLNFLMARDKLNPLQLKGELIRPFPKLDLDQLIHQALLHRPDILKLKTSLDKEKLVQKQSYLGYMPDLNLGLSKHRIKGEIDTWDVQLSFEVPLFFWQRKRGEIEEANANISSISATLEHAQLSASLEVENARQNAISYKNQLDLFETEVLKEANQVYQMTMISYQEGKISSIELIESRRTLIDMKQTYANTLLYCQLALAQLERSMGRPLLINQGEKNE